MISGDHIWMEYALELASFAGNEGEIPIGSVIVKDNQIVGRGWNRTELLQQPCAHAEMFAIADAASNIGSRRLLECTLYSTLEPCAMCAGAIVLARIPRLVYAASDVKSGACRSLFEIADDPRLNHRCNIRCGVLEEKASAMLKDFFHRLRTV